MYFTYPAYFDTACERSDMLKKCLHEDVTAEGHLIDSNLLARIFNNIVELGGEFEVLSLAVGSGNQEPSKLSMRMFGKSNEHLVEMLMAVQEFGVVPLYPEDACLMPAPADGVFPEGFYSTTNLETSVRLMGSWVPVEETEMDLGVRIDKKARAAFGTAITRVHKGDLFVVGRKGVRVSPQERPREQASFEFMNSAVSSEKPKLHIIKEVASLLKTVRAEGLEAISVVGPAVIHTGAADHLARIVKAGYISVLFGGNAVATHDIEVALYGTSLGIDMESGTPQAAGHEHHLRAINKIRAAGSIHEAVEKGILTQGLMYTLVQTGTPFVLAGSIRDDGPLPDVITDTVQAQEAMRSWCQKAGACVMFSSMLHSIAVGNLLPASVATVCVDINPAVVTKLSDRGSWQTIGIVTDVGLFLEQLADELEC